MLRRIATLLLLQQCRAYSPAAGAVAVRRAADLARVAAAPRAAVDTSEEKTGTAAKLVAPVAVRREGKLYTAREAPKFAGGVKVGARRVVVITGASSGLGLSATIALLAAAQKKNYFVVAAVRDPERMENVAKENGISRNDYVALKLELASLQSVKDFVANLKLFLPARPISHLICNAACSELGLGLGLRPYHCGPTLSWAYHCGHSEQCPAQLLRLLGARLAALGRSTLPGKRPAH